MFYIANEAISVLENAGRMGVPYPKKLKELLEQLKKDNDAGGGDGGQ
jgi:phage-related holin